MPRCGQVQLEVIEFEGYIHDWKSSEFQKCVYNNLGTNQMSLKCQELFSQKKIKERGITLVEHKEMLCTPVKIDFNVELALYGCDGFT